MEHQQCTSVTLMRVVTAVRENPEQPVEVLCGVISDLTKVSKSQREHVALLDALGVSELKASDAYRGRKNWGQLKPAERDALFDKMLDWASERSCKLIVSPIDAKKFFSRKRDGCACSTRLGSPWEAAALHLLLTLQRYHQNKRSNKGRTMIIFDEQKEHDDRLLRLLAGDLQFTDGFTGFNPKKPKGRRRLDQMIDVPHFSKSHLAVLLQVADWAAFVVNRALRLRVYGEKEAYAGEGAKLERWYRGVEQLSVPPAALDAMRASDELSQYFREQVRPKDWTWKRWP